MRQRIIFHPLTGDVQREPEPTRKPRRNPFSRARAKKWFARKYPGLRIFRYDGKKTFYLNPVGQWDNLLDSLSEFNATFGEFTFTTHSPAKMEDHFVRREPLASVTGSASGFLDASTFRSVPPETNP